MYTLTDIHDLNSANTSVDEHTHTHTHTHAHARSHAHEHSFAAKYMSYVDECPKQWHVLATEIYVSEEMGHDVYNGVLQRSSEKSRHTVTHTKLSLQHVHLSCNLLRTSVHTNWCANMQRNKRLPYFWGICVCHFICCTQLHMRQEIPIKHTQIHTYLSTKQINGVYLWCALHVHMLIRIHTQALRSGLLSPRAHWMCVCINTCFHTGAISNGLWIQSGVPLFFLCVFIEYTYILAYWCTIHVPQTPKMIRYHRERAAHMSISQYTIEMCTCVWM
jgi:hypothetical protein